MTSLLDEADGASEDRNEIAGHSESKSIPEVQGYGIKFKIPDKPADEQLEMVKSLKKIMQTFAEVANDQLDSTPFDDIISRLEAKIATGDLSPLDTPPELSI